MFYSILFSEREQQNKPCRTDEPECFRDLNLSRVISHVLHMKKEFGLEEFYYSPLHDAGIVRYRQDVMRELENDELRSCISEFAENVYRLGHYMDRTRVKFTSGSGYLVKGHMLDYADRYCGAVSALSERLGNFSLQSAGLSEFAEYISMYSKTEKFTGLQKYVKRLREEFSTVKYCMLINRGTVRVRKYEGQENHSEQILAAFEKFRQDDDTENYLRKIPEEPAAEHVEEAVLRIAAKLYPEIFADLDKFCSAYISFDDETIRRFSREVQFYLAWLDFIRPLKAAGLPFNYPEFRDTKEKLYICDGFDIALASVIKEKTVVNDFRLTAPEQILVVTGPNQGGKTTYARAFGQIHYLGALGLCVPGRKSALYLFDNIFTHFGREEDLSTLNGKLRDDLERLHELLSKATDRSIIIINEIFSSTTLSDALSLGGHMMDAVIKLGAPAVVVTFLDELASYSRETVSIMSTVSENNPAERTFKIVRKPADGLAYAMHLADRHGLTYEKLCRRLNK